MLIDLGNYSLGAAVLVTAGAIFSAVAAGVLGSSGWLRAARGCMVVLTALLTFASLLLLYAMVTSDFRLAYVAAYSEAALPVGYKAAAFWAGQSGSLLLWAWILGVLNLVLIRVQRKEQGGEPAGTIGVMAAVTGFFVVLMLFAPGTRDEQTGAPKMLSANPFEVSLVQVAPGVWEPGAPKDGYGLNPMLQNAGMMAHPPLMFIGYAGYTYPFAIWLAAMFVGRSDNGYLKRLHRWNLFAWVFLSAGILWGAEWAYKELGWGGYWAWDPVENASLLPWLTGTALIHAIIIQRQKGIFKNWTAGLIAASFILCIGGTYLTRSGVVSSVHSFGEHPIGDFLLTFIVLCTLFSIAVIIWRQKLLRPEAKMEWLISREGAFLGICVLLTGAMIVTLIGTIFPVLTTIWSGEKIEVSQAFYNKVLVPMGLALVALMVLAPLLKYDRSLGKLLTGLALPMLGGVAVVAVMWQFYGINHIAWPVTFQWTGSIWGFVRFHGLTNDMWAMLSALIVTPLVLTVLIDVGRGTWRRASQMGENVVTAFFRLVDGNHRRYGAWVVHLGMAMMIAGIAGSSLFDVNETRQFSPGQSMQIGGYTLVFNNLKEERRANYTAVVADVTLTDSSGRVRNVKPERRFFDKAENAYSEVAIQRSLQEDLYLVLAGWENGGRITAIQAIISPLVNWIWIGAVVLCLGGIGCMLPRFFKQARPIPVEPLEEPAPRAARPGTKPRPRRKQKTATQPAATVSA